MLLLHSSGKKRNETGIRTHRVYPSFANLRNSPEALFLRDVLSGTIWCAAAASFLCIVLADSPFKAETPLLFLSVLLVIAARFGAAAGSIGTAMAALIFAEFLFEPIHKLAVNNLEARSDLGWMILGGLAVSALLGKSRKPLDTGQNSSGSTT